MIPATDFLVTGLPAIGSIQSFCKCRVRLWLLAQLNKDVFLCRTAVRWSLRSQCSQTRSRDCVEYSRKQHRSPREGTLPQQLNTLSRMIHERRGASFMPYAGFSNLAAIYGEMTCLWWQLIHDFTFHIIRLSVKKCCFEIKLERFQPLLAALRQLIRNPGIVEAGESVLLVTILFVLGTSQYPYGLFLRKLPCLSVLMVSTIVRSNRPSVSLSSYQWNQEPLLATPDSHSTCFDSSNCLYYPRASWTDASFRARDLILTFAPAASPQVAIQCTNLFLVWPSTPHGTSICVPESLISLSSRSINDRCTHCIVVKLQTSCCAPLSVITKQNDPAATAYLLCAPSVTVQCPPCSAHHWSEQRSG